jgi:hypothetical protein
LTVSVLYKGDDMRSEKPTLLAIRYILQQGGGYWEVRTPETIEPHASLRLFQADWDLTESVLRALAQPGEWVKITSPDEAER